jgi:hypothetical protein
MEPVAQKSQNISKSSGEGKGHIAYELINLHETTRRRGIVVIQAFFDESGTHEGAPVLCVAAYAGKREEWHAFVQEWLPVLTEFGIDCFHAKEAECNPLRPFLVEAISKRNLRGVVCSVNPKVWETYASKQFKSSGNAYIACAYNCMWYIKGWAKENDLGSVDVIIESGQPNSFYLRDLVDNLMICEPDSGIASVAIAKKRDHIPLQTADFLSHAYCDRNTYWHVQLANLNNIWSYHMKPEHLAQASDKIKSLISKRRKMRQETRRKERRNLEGQNG